MSWRSSALVVGTLVTSALVLALDVRARPAESVTVKTIYVQSDGEFAGAVSRLRRSGGRIVLLPGLYRWLIIGPRYGPPLQILGRRGVRVENVFIDRARWVSLGRVTIAPIGQHALVNLRRSRHIVLHDLNVTARGTRFSSSVLVHDSRFVTIRRSNFTHCGDRSRKFTNCVTLFRWSHDVVIEQNRFHDCLGCDFVHGRFGSDLTIRRNRFERALPCRMSRHRCGHQDLVQLFAGRRLLVAGNHFGVYRAGGAQLYLTNSVDYATIVNNVFVGTDPRVPRYHARMGIVVGSNASRRLPHHAKIVNNTILTGARRRDGYAGSIRMSSRYGSVPRWKRPIVANNVIALLETPGRVCGFTQRFVQNVVIRGRPCTANDNTGPIALDRRGRPRASSTVIDAGSRHFAPRTDATGRRRYGKPDIGAFEFRREPRAASARSTTRPARRGRRPRRRSPSAPAGSASRPA